MVSPVSIEFIFMLVGFTLAAYAVVGNDSIQTLGTFLASNQHRPWWVLWIFAGGILAYTLVAGWAQYEGDVSYGRLTGTEAKFPPVAVSVEHAEEIAVEQRAALLAETIEAGQDPSTIDYSELKEPIVIEWFFLLPPIALLFLTRFGFPVSTSFLVLLSFSFAAGGPMILKSLAGYGVAFGCGLLIYIAVLHLVERFVSSNPDKPAGWYWVVAQWLSTAWLWHNWLKQDLANIFVYMPRDLPVGLLIFAIVIMLAMLAYIFASRGGPIQKVVLQKTNTTDIGAATFVDLIYGTVLFIFKEYSTVPMSTTWVFLGLLAGRELGIRIMAHFLWKTGVVDPAKKSVTGALRLIGLDAGKAAIGLAISIGLAYLINVLR